MSPRSLVARRRQRIIGSISARASSAKSCTSRTSRPILAAGKGQVEGGRGPGYCRAGESESGGRRSNRLRELADRARHSGIPGRRPGGPEARMIRGQTLHRRYRGRIGAGNPGPASPRAAARLRRATAARGGWLRGADHFRTAARAAARGLGRGEPAFGLNAAQGGRGRLDHPCEACGGPNGRRGSEVLASPTCCGPA